MTEFNIFEDSPAEPTLPAGQDKEDEMSADKEIDSFAIATFLPNDKSIEAGSVSDLFRLIGRAESSHAIAKIANVVSLSQLAYIKDNKLYRHLRGVRNTISPNGCEFKGVWADIPLLLGISQSKVDEDLLNHRLFGEETLAAMSHVGFGYRDLAQFRKLPDDEKTALIEAAKSGDKEQLVDLAELLIEKHIKEKAVLTTQAADLTEEIKFVERRANNMNAEIERLELVNERLGKKKERLTKFEEHTEAVRDECMHLQAGCELHLNSLQQLFEQVVNDAPTAEQGLRIEQIYVAASVAASHAFSMLEAMRALIPDGCPQRVQGQHILTPAEAERWMLDAQMLASTHAAEKLARELKREAKQDADKPKGRGRPAGATNKAKQ